VASTMVAPLSLTRIDDGGNVGNRHHCFAVGVAPSEATPYHPDLANSKWHGSAPYPVRSVMTVPQDATSIGSRSPWTLHRCQSSHPPSGKNKRSRR
jgi:hypothetical protein